MTGAPKPDRSCWLSLDSSGGAGLRTAHSHGCGARPAPAGAQHPPPTSGSFPSDTSTPRSQSSEDRSTRSPRATQPLPPAFPPGPSLRAGPFSAPLHTPEAPPAGLSPPRLPPHSAHSPSLSLALGTPSSSVHILLPPGPTGHPSRPDT